MKVEKSDNIIAQKVHDLMICSGKTISTAESCTCGRIAATLASVPEAAEYVQGGLAAYQNEVKVEFLGVDEEMIEKYDVVSKPVVEQMVKGACRMFHTDYAIASTGYAGRGHDEFPQGLIWIGWGTEDEVHSMVINRNRGKEKNIQYAEKLAIYQFYKFLKTNNG